MDPEIVADYRCVTGEGPLWHPEDELLYWTDIPTGRLFRYDPATGDHEQCYDGEVVGGFTIQADGSLLLFGEAGRVWTWRDGEGAVVLEGIPAEADSRFNDVIADPQGRVFCGTMPTDDRLGRLYRLDRDGSVTRLLDGVDVPNGMGFAPGGEEFYFTDTWGRTISRFDYDAETGAISNREPVVSVPEDPSEGGPDGMTVDEEGYLWSARWDGGCLVRYAPDGTAVERIEFPARKVSSVTFGGPDYQTAYVTTALGGTAEDPNDRETEGAGAGALFALDLGVGGVPEHRSRIGT